jgi:hypothetical protein
MRTVTDKAVLEKLIARLQAVQPESRGRWGTLTAPEMLCHLGDATAMVLRIRPRTKPVPQRSRPLFKLLALWSPLRWPHGRATSPMLDPKAEGTKPATFAADLDRAVDGLRGLAAAPPEVLEPAHGLFGVMSRADWQRWAYKHTDHHLRQFGL